MKKFWKLAATAAAASLLVTACGGSDSSSDTTAPADTTPAASLDVKAAVVYLGVPDDKGWTYQHEQGIAAAEQELGIEIKRVENVLDNADSEKVFEQLAGEGYQVIFATSFGYGAPMAKVAVKNPNTCMQWATGAKFLLTKDGGGEFATFDDVPKNLGTYFGAAEEARYLIPEVLRGINAFTLGAQSVNPNATVQVVWTSTWFGPAKEKAAAESLRDAGVDVLSQHQDSPATGEVAEEAGLKWVGYNDDLERFAPQAWLTGAVWDWGPFYIATARSVIDGTWKSDQYYGTIADGLVGLAPFGPSVSQATKDQIAAKQAAIVDGSFKPFTGPIEDQNGNVVVPAGQTASLVDLLGTDYFVKGVIGEIPED